MENTNRVSECLRALLDTSEAKEAYKILRSCVRHSTRFDKKYADLFDLYSHLLHAVESLTDDTKTQTELTQRLEEGLNLIKKCAIDYINGQAFPHAHGLSIYFDRKKLDASYLTTHWAQNTQWLSFLEKYHTFSKV